MTGETASEGWSPLILTVAPNGARKTKNDHPALPITAEEIAATGADCLAAGASMIHLHVRDANAGHTLSPSVYRDTIKALRDRVGRDLVVQATSEAVGIYSPEEQMAMVRELKPEAVSLALRELLPQGATERDFASFVRWLADEDILPQWILYSADELRRFEDLKRRGVIPEGRCFRLYVLGRYTAGQRSEPRDLLSFLQVSEDDPWAVCAFGPKEAASALMAATLGGHARVGFENNVHLPDGSIAPDNATLVAIAAGAAKAFGRPLATADQTRAIMRGEA